MSIKTDDLLTTDQVIDYFIERPQLRRAALSCVLPAVRMNGQWLYRRADLDAWLQSQRVQAHQQALTPASSEL